ncbi:MAG TPA: methyltransferase domain-containing protein [Myxococcota bacterium]|nr:methyltransferase domain-containing protein [Myxococcota bacterium]
MTFAIFPDINRDLETIRRYSGFVSSNANTAANRYSRVYVGAEFCAHRLPAPADVAAVQRMCGDAGLDFTLVLPVLFDTSFGVVDRLVAMMPPGTEIVINDWGELAPVLDAGCRPVFGRAMNRLVRDPRVDPATRDGKDLTYLGTSQAHVSMVREFLRSRGVVRVELDNVRQGLAPMPDASLPSSLYTPWSLVSVSRYCGEAPASVCRGKPCFFSRTFVEGVPIIVDGTSTFWFNDRIPADLPSLGVDRLVQVTGPEGLSWLERLMELEVGAPMPGCGGGGVVPSVCPPFYQSIFKALDSDFKSVCHIGCGTGAHLEVLDRMGKKLSGVDPSRDRITWAMMRVPAASLTVSDVPVADSGGFDLIVDTDFASSSRDSGFASVVLQALVPGGLAVIETGDSDISLVGSLFRDHLALVWHAPVPSSGADAAGRSLVVLRRSSPEDPDVARIAARIDAFMGRAADVHASDFADLSTEPGWIGSEAQDALSGLGFRFVWRERDGEGRTIFRVSSDDRRFELEFAPVSQNRPSYRCCGTHTVAHRGTIPSREVLDQVIDLLFKLV